MANIHTTEKDGSADAEKGFDGNVVKATTSPLVFENDRTTSKPQSGRQYGTLEISTTFLSNLLRACLQKSASSSALETPPPDGGLRAWTIVFFSFMAGFNTIGIMNAYGVLQTHYVATLHLAPSTASWIGSLSAFLTLFLGAFSGRLSDMGYFHQIHVLGTFLQTLGFFTASASTTYWQILLSHGICIGLGGGLLFVPSVSIVGTYFDKNRALALALVPIGNSVGGLVFAAVLQNVLPTLGYGWAMRVCGFVVMASAVPALFVLRPRSLRRIEGGIVEWRAFREVEYAVFAAGMFFAFMGMWVPVFYVSHCSLCQPPRRSGSLSLSHAIVGHFRSRNHQNLHTLLLLAHPNNQRRRHSRPHPPGPPRQSHRAAQSHDPAHAPLSSYPLLLGRRTHLLLSAALRRFLRVRDGCRPRHVASFAGESDDGPE